MPRTHDQEGVTGEEASWHGPTTETHGPTTKGLIRFGWTLVQGAFGILLGVLVLGNWSSSSRYVIGCFFSLALLFDGLGLLATGLGGRRVVGLMTADDESKHVQPE